MALSLSERGRRAAKARWRDKTAEQRQAQGQKMRLALAIKELVDQAPALSQEQRNKLRVILTQAPSGGGRDGA